jgi:hypothetical protein
MFSRAYMYCNSGHYKIPARVVSDSGNNQGVEEISATDQWCPVVYSLPRQKLDYFGALTWARTASILA